MIIRVTADHIKDGIPRAATRCPVALALREAIGENCLILASQQYLSVERGKLIDTYEPTKAMATWMDMFDAGMPVEPRTFRVRKQRPKVFTRSLRWPRPIWEDRCSST